MLTVFAETEIKAEKRAGQRAYLARVAGGQRTFGKTNFKDKNRRGFALSAAAGDVFEARRFWWDGEKDAGGTVWFTIDNQGHIHPLTRDEAMDLARGAASVEFRGGGDLAPAKALAPVGRMPLERVACRFEESAPELSYYDLNELPQPSGKRFASRVNRRIGK